MSIKYSKTETALSLVNGVVIGSSVQDVDMLASIESLSLHHDGSGVAFVAISVNGSPGALTSASYSVNWTPGDVFAQAYTQLLSLPDFDGGVIV